MSRRENLVAVGSDAEPTQGTAAEQAAAEETLVLDEPIEELWEDEPAPRSRDWLVPSLAVLATLAWTGFFGWAHRGEMLAGGTAEQWSGWIVAWAVPVLLVVSLWLLALRHSRREAARFGNVARTLSQESARLEHRLAVINRELSLARDFIASRGLPEPVVLDGAQNREAVAIAAREIAAASHPRPTAVLVESDFTAVTVIEELQRRGMSVPGDVAVIGCGNAEEGYYCNPRLTTIGPTWLSITEAAEHLIYIMQKGGKTTPRRFTIPWTLYIRESG